MPVGARQAVLSRYNDRTETGTWWTFSFKRKNLGEKWGDRSVKVKT